MTTNVIVSLVCTLKFNSSLSFSEQASDLEAQMMPQVDAYLSAQQATAAVHDALVGLFEGMGVSELPVKGALFTLANQVPDLNEEIIKTCCEANPETFKYLPAHGLRKNAMVARVMEKNESEKSSGSASVPPEKVEAVVKAITEEPERGAIYYKAKFGFDKGQWEPVINLALKSGRVGKKGERGNTVYFPIAA